MALVIFAHEGNSIDYTPTSAVAAGDVVVQGDLIGVVRTPITANTLGSLAVVGVFDFPKAAGAGSGIDVGTKVYWDVADRVATATAGTNKALGKTVQAAADADTTARVKLIP